MSKKYEYTKLLKMGKFSKIVADKSDLELKEMISSILNFQALFIDDYISEIDKRGLLTDIKKSISDTKLLSLASKLNEISESKSLIVIFNEIQSRGLGFEYEASLKKKEIEESIRKNKKWYHGILDRSIKLFLVVSIIITWILYKEGVIFKKNKKVETTKLKDLNLPPTKLPHVKLPPYKLKINLQTAQERSEDENH